MNGACYRDRKYVPVLHRTPQLLSAVWVGKSSYSGCAGKDTVAKRALHNESSTVNAIESPAKPLPVARAITGSACWYPFSLELFNRYIA